MGAQMQLPDSVWNTLNWAWTGFFAVMGVLNLWVAFNFDTDTWVNFKLFGGIGLMLVFVVAQALYLSRYLKEPRTKHSRQGLAAMSEAITAAAMEAACCAKNWPHTPGSDRRKPPTLAMPAPMAPVLARIFGCALPAQCF